MACLLNLKELQRIKQWHVAHRFEHPIEYYLLDGVLTIWLLGCIGWLPAMLFGHEWLLPLCLPAMFAPQIYVRWRERAHQQSWLRCDWLPPSGTTGRPELAR